MAHEKSRKSFKSHTKAKKNPYSDRGLDKFSALLTNLGQKRNQIYSQTDPKNIVLIRFSCKNSEECVPLVVKQRNEKKDKQLVAADDSEPTKQDDDDDNKSLVPGTDSRRLRNPLSYVIAVVILILFLLSVFSRLETILWISVVWYLVPVFKQTSVQIKKN